MLLLLNVKSVYFLWFGHRLTITKRWIQLKCAFCTGSAKQPPTKNNIKAPIASEQWSKAIQLAWEEKNMETEICLPVRNYTHKMVNGLSNVACWEIPTHSLSTCLVQKAVTDSASVDTRLPWNHCQQCIWNHFSRVALKPYLPQQGGGGKLMGNSLKVHWRRVVVLKW